jgi:hypothetical protein
MEWTMMDTVTRNEEEEEVPTTGQPKAGSSPAARQKDRESGNDSKGLVTRNPSPASLQMLLAFSRLNYRVYEGTVPRSVVLRRRKANKVARKSRRVNRGRA